MPPPDNWLKNKNSKKDDGQGGEHADGAELPVKPARAPKAKGKGKSKAKPKAKGKSKQSPKRKARQRAQQLRRNQQVQEFQRVTPSRPGSLSTRRLHAMVFGSTFQDVNVFTYLGYFL